MRGLKLVYDLQPEQVDVINQVTLPGPSNELFLVQGVAGSGKTTMALHIARKLGIDNHSLSPSRQSTILFLTYNPRLAEYCANTLQDIPDLVGQVNIGGQVTSNKINVLGIQDFFKQALDPEEARACLSDEACIGYLGLIAGRRGVHSLLPSQIYSLIVTFLRGRPELIGLSVEDLEKKIQSEMSRSRDYLIYGESLQDIRSRLLKTYEEWKGNRLDRADVAARFRQQAQYVEEMLCRMTKVEAVDLRKDTQYVLGDRDSRMREMTIWLSQIFSGFKRIAAISSAAEGYARIFAGRSLSEDTWYEMRKDLLSWIAQYGMASEPLWGSLLCKLPNPVVIVDEVQDLSSVELENLVNLWFLLPKSTDSRLILFGDVNQQMTPSGFDWSTLVRLVSEKEAVYERRIKKEVRPTDLKNNYRTTEHIARAVQSMTSQVARRFPPEIADRFMEYCINPDTTLPISLQEKILTIEESDEEDALVPRLFVGSEELFQQALVRYAAELKLPDTNPEVDNQILSTVVITQHADQLEQLLDQDENRYALETNLLEVIPVMSCKGMEFDRCVLYGISIKSNCRLEPDIVSNWYTSLTRARLLLFIYLTEDEYTYLRWAGWQEIPNDVVFVRHPDKVDQIVNAIRSIGNTEVDDETMYGMAELSFTRYLKTRNEAYLETSLRRYKEVGRTDAYRSRSATAAIYFRDQGELRKAADYFERASDPVQQVECLEKHRQDLLKKAQADKAREIYEEIETVILSLDEDHNAEQARCYLILDELGQALEKASKSDELLQTEIAERIYSRIQTWLSEKKMAEANWATDLLRQFGHWSLATQALLLLDRWEEAFETAARCSELEMVGRRALTRIEMLTTKNRHLGRRIAELLSEWKMHLFAGKARLIVRDYFPAIEEFVLAGELKLAEKHLDSIKEEDTIAAYQLLADGYFSKGVDGWPSAYYYHYLAMDHDRMRYIDNRCRAEKKYIPLALCYQKANQLEKIRDIANYLELVEDHREAEIAAQCWEIAGIEEQAAKNWMRVFFRESDQFEKLLGPNPKDGKLDTASKNRFYKHMTERHSAYGVDSQEWSDLDYYAGSDRDQIRKISKVVARMSQSESWRKDLEQRIAELQEVYHRAGMVFPSGDGRLKALGRAGLSEDQVILYWNSLELILYPFWDRAVEIAESVFEHNALLGIQIMASICKRLQQAEQMAMRLSRRRDPESREVYIQSWQYLNWSLDRTSQELSHLSAVNDAKFILEAIDLYFSKDSSRHKEELERFKKRLTGVKTGEARNLLQKHFPDYEPDSEHEKRKRGKRQPDPVPLKLEDLLSLLLEKSRSWEMNDDDRDEFTEQLSGIQHMHGRATRLTAKLKALRGLIPPEILQQEMGLLNQIDEAVALAAVKGDVPNQDEATISPGSVYKKKDDIVHSFVPEIQTSCDQRSASDQNQQLSNHRRRSRMNKDEPGKLFRLDLHNYNQNDADQEVEDVLTQVIEDKQYRALLVIHGYGKDKEPSVLKDNVRKRLRRFSKHGRSRKLLYGENINRFDDDWNLAVRLCSELQDSNEICQNPGITLVLLKNY